MWEAIKKAIKRVFCKEVSVQQETVKDYSDMIRRFRMSSAMDRVSNNANVPEEMCEAHTGQSCASESYTWTWESWKRENARQVALIRTKSEHILGA